MLLPRSLSLTLLTLASLLLPINSARAVGLTLTANQGVVSDNRTLALSYAITPTLSEVGSLKDIYVGVVPPAGGLFLLDSKANWSTSRAPMTTNFSLAERTSYLTKDFYAIQLPAEMPIGQYTFYLLATTAGSDITDTRNWSGLTDTTVEVASPTVTYPFTASISAFLQSTRDYTLNATLGADAYQLKWHSEPGVADSFEGHAASTLKYTNAITKNGSVIAGSALTQYFDVTPFKPFGGINHTLGNYDVASDQQLLPSAALPGQSGFLNNGTRYVDGSKTQAYATSVTRWSLEAAGASTAWACLISTIKQTGSTAMTTESVCYKIDASGNVSTMKIDLTLNGQTLNFQ